MQCVSYGLCCLCDQWDVWYSCCPGTCRLLPSDGILILLRNSVPTWLPVHLYVHQWFSCCAGVGDNGLLLRHGYKWGWESTVVYWDTCVRLRVCIAIAGEQSVQHLHHRTHQKQHTSKTIPVHTGFVLLVYSYGTLIKHQHQLQGYLINLTLLLTRPL